MPQSFWPGTWPPGLPGESKKRREKERTNQLLNQWFNKGMIGWREDTKEQVETKKEGEGR